MLFSGDLKKADPKNVLFVAYQAVEKPLTLSS
jgi:hypothetical protein